MMLFSSRHSSVDPPSVSLQSACYTDFIQLPHGSLGDVTINAKKGQRCGKGAPREGFAPASASCAPGPVSRGHGGGSSEKVGEISHTGRVLLLLRRLDRSPLWCQRCCCLCPDFTVAVGRSHGLNNGNRHGSNFLHEDMVMDDSKLWQVQGSH